MIGFDYQVKKDSIDPNLFNKFVKNIDLFQRKGTRLYHEKLLAHGHESIWADGVVSLQIREWRDSVKQTSDALYRYLASGIFDIDLSKYMPMSDFKTMYFNWIKEEFLPKPTWNKDHYHNEFQEHGISVEHSKTKEIQQSKKQTTG